MKARAIKTKEGWYLRDLPGFEDIKAETIEVEVTLSAEEASSRTYKELRGVAIMERFMEKEARSTLKASKSMTVTSNKITPALSALLNELRDECTAAIKLIHQLEIEHLTEDQREDLLGELAASVTHLAVHSGIVKEELDKGWEAVRQLVFYPTLSFPRKWESSIEAVSSEDWIPGQSLPLACPVLDTGYSIRG